MRAGSPRIVFATALMRAAFSADLELVKLLLSYGADPKVISSDGETMVEAAASLGFIQGYSKGKSPEERLEVVKLFVGLGADVNQADDYGITLMVAGNLGDTAIIQYLVKPQGANLAAYDLGKKNDGAFGASVKPLLPVDYAIGVGTFVPNNAVIDRQFIASYLGAGLSIPMGFVGSPTVPGDASQIADQPRDEAEPWQRRYRIGERIEIHLKGYRSVSADAVGQVVGGQLRELGADIHQDRAIVRNGGDPERSAA